MHEILSLQRMLSVEVIYFCRDCEKAFWQSWERSIFPFAVSITPKQLRFKINKGRANKKNYHGNALTMKRKEKYRLRIFIQPLVQGL